ncbi:MAG: GTPase Era [Clostridia bacterium]|nr:GTPase Era [Clostridia bacterium]
MIKSEFKSGFVTIVGRPNVGKSSLLNALLKQKVSIVSPKPQTTRNKITGILNSEDYQIVFLDTPGIHKSRNKLDEYMEKSIDLSLEGVDVVLYVLDGLKPFDQEDIDRIEYYAKKTKTIVVVNKIDRSSFEKLYPKLNKLNSLKNVEDIIPTSAIKGKNLDLLLEYILKYIPQGIPYYPTEDVTDVSMRFMASEIIREKMLYNLDKEVPHGIAVLIEEYTESEQLIRIGANIICEKQSHKNIIIGKDGAMLKKIGQQARLELEGMVEKKIYLDLWVKVKDKWRDSQVMTINMGYNKKDL